MLTFSYERQWRIVSANQIEFWLSNFIHSFVCVCPCVYLSIYWTFWCASFKHTDSGENWGFLFDIDNGIHTNCMQLITILYEWSKITIKKRISRKLQYRNAQMFGHTIKSIHHFAKYEMKKADKITASMCWWVFGASIERTHTHAQTCYVRMQHTVDISLTTERVLTALCLFVKKCRQFNAISIKRTHTQTCPEK